MRNGSALGTMMLALLLCAPPAFSQPRAPAGSPCEQMPCRPAMGRMMGEGMMPGGMMEGGMPGMMGGGMMEGGMPGMMGGGMTGMMPRHRRGCLGVAEGMLRGRLDLQELQKSLGLTQEQADRLRAVYRPLQKETITRTASMKVAELEVADLLAQDKVDLGKIESKLKEIEGLRVAVRLGHLRASEEVKSILPREKLEKFEELRESHGMGPCGCPRCPLGAGAREEGGP